VYSGHGRGDADRAERPNKGADAVNRSHPAAPDPRSLDARDSTHLDGPIELRVKEIGQIFHTLDPLPFRERDLDSGVEEYIVGWAGEIAGDHEISIIVHLPTAEAQRTEALHIEEVIRNYFAYRSKVLGWELRDLFRTGRVSLVIGLAVLAVCIALGKGAGDLLGTDYLGRFLEEGLIILGWVANWRPVQIFLYDWWPIVRRRRLYRRLSLVQVKIEPEDPQAEDAHATNEISPFVRTREEAAVTRGLSQTPHLAASWKRQSVDAPRPSWPFGR
jgi:hypothetical protein